MSGRNLLWHEERCFVSQSSKCCRSEFHMVTVANFSAVFNHDFATTTLAYFLKYPNPFASHVVSCDTFGQWIDGSGRLWTERIIHKQGNIPSMFRAVVGGISDSWMVETSVVDRQCNKLQSWTRNIDHRFILRVDDIATYSSDGPDTLLNHRVEFRSKLGWGIRNRVESWCSNHFASRLENSHQGLAHVMKLIGQNPMS